MCLSISFWFKLSNISISVKNPVLVGFYEIIGVLSLSEYKIWLIHLMLLCLSNKSPCDIRNNSLEFW